MLARFQWGGGDEILERGFFRGNLLSNMIYRHSTKFLAKYLSLYKV